MVDDVIKSYKYDNAHLIQCQTIVCFLTHCLRVTTYDVMKNHP